MRSPKSDMWKAGIAVAGMLLLLVLIVWVPVSAVDAHERASGLAASETVTVQATPTVNTTEVVQDQLKQQDIKLQRDNSFPWTILNAVSSSIGTILVAAAALIAAWLGWRQWLTNRKDEQNKQEIEQGRWRKEREEERRKQDEERFQKVVEGFGGDNERAKVGAAILLRTFLRPGYEQFYTQTSDLAVANLRLRHIDLNISEPLNSISQSLITVFKESFLLARNTHKQDPHLLDAARVQLDCAYLAQADLMGIWMPEAYLRNANLAGANFRNANLAGAKLQEAILSNAQLINAILTKATFYEADLIGANLTGANLAEAYLVRANFTNAILIQTDFTKADFLNADLTSVNLTNANLTNANFHSAVLTEAILTAAYLKGTEPEKAKTLEGTKMHHIKGLTKDQLEACKTKGAIIDEDLTTSSSQPTVSPSTPSQSNDVQAQSAPSAQRSRLIPDAGGSNAVSSQQDLES